MTVKRNTVQKDIVLEAVRGMYDHPTADAIYHQIKHEHNTISRATVFRVLKQMAEQGIIHRVRVPDGADRFDFRTDRHYHIKCSSCGQVVDVGVCDIGDLTKKVYDANGYFITGCNVTFDGICPACNKKEKSYFRDRSPLTILLTEQMW